MQAVAAAVIVQLALVAQVVLAAAAQAVAVEVLQPQEL
jgi:hypothetical protein